MNSNGGIRDYLGEIAKRSNDGKIIWSKVNPTTYQWKHISADGQQLIVTLQKADVPRSKYMAAIVSGSAPESLSKHHFLFQVLDKREGVLFSISSEDRPEYHAILDAIYSRAEKSADFVGSEVLRRLLD